MPDLDATAIAALAGEAIDPAFFAFLDIVGMPIRVTTAGFDVTFAATGDAELDGAYEALNPRFVDIGDVVHQEGGSDTLTCRLSGIVAIDEALLDAIADKANWQGRVARLWVRLRDADGAWQGAVAGYYTGYMNALDIIPAPDSQVIELRIENYLSLLTSASNRTLLSQAEYDSGDLSAGATIGAANGAKASPTREDRQRGIINNILDRAF